MTDKTDASAQSTDSAAGVPQRNQAARTNTRPNTTDKPDADAPGTNSASAVRRRKLVNMWSYKLTSWFSVPFYVSLYVCGQFMVQYLYKKRKETINCDFFRDLIDEPYRVLLDGNWPVVWLRVVSKLVRHDVLPRSQWLIVAAMSALILAQSAIMCPPLNLVSAAMHAFQLVRFLFVFVGSLWFLVLALLGLGDWRISHRVLPQAYPFVNQTEPQP